MPNEGIVEPGAEPAPTNESTDMTEPMPDSETMQAARVCRSVTDVDTIFQKGMSLQAVRALYESNTDCKADNVCQPGRKARISG